MTMMRRVKLGFIEVRHVARVCLPAGIGSKARASSGRMSCNLCDIIVAEAVKAACLDGVFLLGLALSYSSSRALCCPFVERELRGMVQSGLGLANIVQARGMKS